MNLTKSKYCSAIQCKKMLWLMENKKEEATLQNNTVLENGTDVGILARKLLGPSVNIEYQEDKKKMIEETRKVLEEDNRIVTEASFAFDGNFCSVDLLKKTKNSYEIIEVKSSTELHDIYYEDVSYQYYILTNLGYSVTKARIAYLNPNYIRHGDLNLNKLFLFEDVTHYAQEHLSKVKKNIEEIKKYMQKKECLEDEVGMNCFTPYECPFFKYCTKNLPEQNIFHIRRMPKRKKIEYYQNQIYSYKDLLDTKINPKQKQQIEFELYNKTPEIKIENIRSFLKELYYPLYFLDFETYQQSIPLYDGVSPYMQIPFQYSLHFIEEENGILKHKEFLGEAGLDPRRQLAEQLIRDIPKNACVLAYNMMFEKMVIKQLAFLYKDLQKDLMKIYYNIQDLMIPFQKRDYYTKEMYGSYSIKYVLPALFPEEPELNYHNLENIHNGSEASNAYALMIEYSKEDQEKIRKNLLKYCELDTYAMVKIWEKLQEVALQKV